MRQIKFRMCHEAGGHKTVIYPYEGQNFFIGLSGFIYENYGTFIDPVVEEVFDADVFLQQFTGEYDKNGDEIYEGDILEDCDGKRTVIRWSKAYSGWQWCEHDLEYDYIEDFYGGLSTEYKKVVGNIFNE